jgi:hypothetical protein
MRTKNHERFHRRHRRASAQARQVRGVAGPGVPPVANINGILSVAAGYTSPSLSTSGKQAPGAVIGGNIVP